MDPQRSNQVSDDLTNTYDERRFKIYDFLKLKLESEKEEGKFFSEWNELHLRLRAIQNGDCNYQFDTKFMEQLASSVCDDSVQGLKNDYCITEAGVWEDITFPEFNQRLEEVFTFLHQHLDQNEWDDLGYCLALEDDVPCTYEVKTDMISDLTMMIRWGRAYNEEGH